MIMDFLLTSLKLSLGCLFSPHHVNQGDVQKTTPQVTLHNPHTVEESLRSQETQNNFKLIPSCLKIKNKLTNTDDSTGNKKARWRDPPVGYTWGLFGKEV